MERKKFYFSDGPYLQTLKGLYKALSQPEAFVTLLGNSNTGKSSLCRLLNNYLQRKEFRTIYFHYAIESPEMLRTMLSRELDIPESANFPRLVEDALLHGDGKPVILIFDDAHLLTDVTLLEIYRLAEIQANNKRMLNILLCGEPLLEQHLLSRKEFKTLLLNISHKFVIEPMDVETLQQFVGSYLQKAGLPGVEIEPAAMNYFLKSSKGFPGPATSICRIILEEKAGQAELTPLSKQELMQLVQSSSEVRSVTGISKVDNNQWRLLGPVAAVMVIASLGLIYQQLQTDSEPGEGEVMLLADGEDSPFSEVPPVETDTEAESEPEPVPVAATPSPVDPVAAADVEVEPEITDSALALVTAAERGIDQSELVAPEFEDLDNAPAEQVAPTVLRLEDNAEVIVQAPPVNVPEPEPEIETPAQAEPDTGIETDGNVESPLQLAAAEEEDEIIAEPEQADLQPEPVLDLERQLLSSVERWVDGWQRQDLSEYFAAYHPGFEPRYQDSVSQWRANRERVIGGAEWIRLELTEFEIVAELDGQVEVNFWLAYESPTYSDNTLKKLVLGTDGGDWLILEEVNLQVRR